MSFVTSIAILAALGTIGLACSSYNPDVCERCFVISERDDAMGGLRLSVTTSRDGSSVAQGGELGISWRTSNPPSGSAVALFPQKMLTGHVFDPIASALPTSGHYVWQIPIFVMQPAPCAPDVTGGCIGSLNPTTYRIVARLYTPTHANLTEFGPDKVHPTWIARAETGEFAMLTADRK